LLTDAALEIGQRFLAASLAALLLVQEDRPLPDEGTDRQRGAVGLSRSAQLFGKVIVFPVTDRLGLDQMSWATPARWGFASTASTIDLIRLVPGR